MADATLVTAQVARPRRLSWLAAGLWIATTALLIVGLALPAPPSGPDDAGYRLVLAVIVGMIESFATVGALLAVRRPTNPIGWLFVAAGFLLSTTLFAQAFVSRVYATGAVMSPELLTLAQLASVLFQTGLVCAGVVVLVFPDGRLTRWSSWVLAIVLVGILLSIVSDLLSPGTILGELENPLGQPALADLLDVLGILANSLLIGGFLIGAALLAARYRAADEVERKQLQWFAYVALILGVALAIAAVQVAPLSDFAWVAVFGAFTAMPIAIAVAVMRYRLYDIDVLINRTLVYVPLLAVLAGVFAAAIALFERLFVSLTGNTSDVGIVLSTLLVAIMFDPLRRGLEAFVDRRFKPAPPTATAIYVAPDGTVAVGDPRLEAYVESVVRRMLDEKR